MLTFDRINPVAGTWLPCWMARCKLSIYPRGRGLHGSREAHTRVERRKQEGGQAHVRKGPIRDLEWRAQTMDGYKQGQMGTNGLKKGCIQDHKAHIRVVEGHSQVSKGGVWMPKRQAWLPKWRIEVIKGASGCLKDAH
jgi:hypothetical protein